MPSVVKLQPGPITSTQTPPWVIPAPQKPRLPISTSVSAIRRGHLLKLTRLTPPTHTHSDHPAPFFSAMTSRGIWSSNMKPQLKPSSVIFSLNPLSIMASFALYHPDGTRLQARMTRTGISPLRPSHYRHRQLCWSYPNKPPPSSHSLCDFFSLPTFRRAKEEI